MKTSWIVLGLAWITWGQLITPEACAGLLTVDEAVELSARTGRPIFAVAGSAT